MILGAFAPRPASRLSPRPRLSKGWSSPCSAFGLRVGPVPAAPLLTGCGRYDLADLQGRDEERAFQVEQGTWFRKEERGLAREGGCTGRAQFYYLFQMVR